jgi:transposase
MIRRTMRRWPKNGPGARAGLDHQGEYLSQCKAIESISAKLSINHETLRIWVRRVKTDVGTGRLTTDERSEIRELEREVKELRRAKEILKSAATFFGADLDRRQQR